ncbi:Acyl-N-acyltransferase [Cordyceps militaris]|uniref:Acyl-N-acyltransferase n=1 Tax=Cordyceps militaris TaxID=73501 RepID=A0A2H4SBP1_CORMI|nr:Acyl-N-acyltransferase [Cordyceps militaris]
MSGPPPSPALGILRVATPADILRIGIVAAASFCYSPLFRWERPHHEEFPDDTLLSYRTQFKDAMNNDEVVVLVVEDAFMPNENDCTKAIIPPGNGWTPPAEGEKVVVGVASIKLEPGSNRRGQFTSKDVSSYCSGFSFMNMVAVHPAYWRRGHGTKLVNWSISLCKLDNVTQGVSAAEMGANLYKGLGYTFICKVEADGDEDDPEGVFTELLKFVP